MPYHVVVEEQQYTAYAGVVDPTKILVLDKAYQRDYQACDDLGDGKSKGPGPAQLRMGSRCSRRLRLALDHGRQYQGFL